MHANLQDLRFEALLFSASCSQRIIFNSVSHSRDSGANTRLLLLGQSQPPDLAHLIEQPPQEAAEQQNTHHFEPVICCFSDSLDY